jgi:hypothetical protein
MSSSLAEQSRTLLGMLRGEESQALQGTKQQPEEFVVEADTKSRTPLRSNLRSGCMLFVPNAVQARSRRKVMVRDAIAAALGDLLVKVNLVEISTHTTVEVSFSCPTTGFMFKPIANIMQQLKWGQIAPLIRSMILEAQDVLRVELCEAPAESLCWEYARKGYCPRASNCRWVHEPLEAFVIVVTELLPILPPPPLPQPATTQMLLKGDVGNYMGHEASYSDAGASTVPTDGSGIVTPDEFDCPYYQPAVPPHLLALALQKIPTAAPDRWDET